MTASSEVRPPDAQAVADVLADEAARFLVDLWEHSDLWGPRLADEGDQRANDLILERLAELRPDDPVLSEEAPDQRERLDVGRAWIVDPLDGSRGFGSRHSVDWAVHIAYFADGVMQAATVALPAIGRTIAMPDAALAPRADSEQIRIVVSDARAPRLAWELADAVDGVLIGMGSAGMKTAAVLLGEADVYVHVGAMREWDMAAPAAVALAAGAHVSRLDGSPIVFNQSSPIVPDVLVCRPELAATLLEVIGPLRGSGPG
ncbi:MAG: inositol monophosphatase family protein [Acidimicrobiia bacterium]